MDCGGLSFSHTPFPVIVITRRVPVYRAIERNEIPYPCCVPYPKRFYAEVIVTVFKTSQLCAVVHCCAQVLVEHCTEFRTSFISN